MVSFHFALVVLTVRNGWAAVITESPDDYYGDDGYKSSSLYASKSKVLPKQPPPTEVLQLTVDIDATGQVMKAHASCKKGEALYNCITQAVLAALKNELLLIGGDDDNGENSARITLSVDGAMVFSTETYLAELIAASASKNGSKGQAIIGAHVELGAEAYFDKGVSAYLRKVRKQSPKKEKMIRESLEHQKIYRAEQLYAFEVPAKAPDNVKDLANDAMQEAAKTPEPTEEDKEKQKKTDAEEKEAEIAAKQVIIKQMIDEQNKKREEVEKELTKSNNDVHAMNKKEATEQLDLITKQLAMLTLQKSQLSTDKVKKSGNDLLAAGMGGTKTGENFTVRRLIRTLALDSGILLDQTSSHVDEPRKVLFQLSKDVIDRYGNGLLSDKLFTTVSTPSTQNSYEFTTATAKSKAMQRIKALGASSEHSSIVKTAGGVLFGAGGAAVSAAHEQTAADLKKEQADAIEKTKVKVSEYYKVTEYLEPRGLIRMDTSTLVGTFEAKKSVLNMTNYARNLAEATPEAKHDDPRVQHLRLQERQILEDYGSHFCPYALLGGRWEISVDAKSDGTTNSNEMSHATATASSEAYSTSVAAGACYGLACGEASGGDKNNHDELVAEAKKQIQQEAEKTSHTEVRQEWLGGSPGLHVGQWRDSLSLNSNWRIIDRHISSCTGIWKLLPLMLSDEDGWQAHGTKESRKELLNHLAHDLCVTWITEYMPSLLKPKNEKDANNLPHKSQSTKKETSIWLDDSHPECTENLNFGQWSNDVKQVTEASRAKCSTVATTPPDFCGTKMYDSTKADDKCATDACNKDTDGDVTACCKAGAKCSTTTLGFCGKKLYDSTQADYTCATDVCTNRTAGDVEACCKDVDWCGFAQNPADGKFPFASDTCKKGKGDSCLEGLTIGACRDACEQCASCEGYATLRGSCCLKKDVLKGLIPENMNFYDTEETHDEGWEQVVNTRASTWLNC